MYWGDGGDCRRDCKDGRRFGGDSRCDCGDGRRFGGDSRCYLLVSQALVEAGDDGALVHLLTDEDELLHAVAILLVPVAAQPRLAVHQFAQLVFGHGGIPLSGILETHLAACLLEEVAHVGLVGKPAHALAADDALGPEAGDKLVEARQVERTAAVIDKGTYTVLLDLAMLMVVMVVMAVAVVVVVMMVVVAVLMLVIMMMLIVVVVLVLVIVMMVLFFCLFVIVGLTVVVLYLVYPRGRGRYVVEIEAAGVEDALKLDVAIVARYDFGLGLDGADNLGDVVELRGSHL